LQKHILLLISLSFSSLALGQRFRRFRRGGRDARWVHNQELILWKGKYYKPKGWKETPTPKDQTEAGPRSQRSRTSFNSSAELSRLAGTKLNPRGWRRPRFSTLPRQPWPQSLLLKSPDGRVYVALHRGQVFVFGPKRKGKKVAEGLHGLRHLALAPDGETLSMIQDKDLYLLRLSDGKRLRLTQDGSENTFNGELDWVYQEEVYGRGNFKGAWWSPRGQHLAFLRIDESPVDSFEILDFLPQTLGIERIKYPKAGRGNPLIGLRVADAKTGKIRKIDRSLYKPEDEILIVRVGWTPAGDRLVFVVQNREQTWMDLNFADPKTGSFVRVLHEERKDAWVERPALPRWLEDGSFLWESDRTGYHHIYRYDSKGKLICAISHGAWSTEGIIRVDEARGRIAFYGTTEKNWIGRQAYVAALDGSWQRMVTRGRGTHRVAFNGDFSLLLDSFSSLENPGEQWLRSVEGRDLHRVYARQPPKGASFPTLRRIHARDGEALDLTFTPPAHLKPGQRYPLWINTYSGPAAPTIRDSYRGPIRPTWFGKLQVNVRSATKRGMKFTKTCYKQLGVQELKDLEDAIDWMAKNIPWVDPSRVGISGGSYGGFMTAFALTHSKKFKCGVASSGVYDWRLYDTIYTERFMQTPQHNPDGYNRSSVVTAEAAKNLRGKLLILHGVKDDNVHFQNAIQLVNALQRAGKQNFVFMPYALSRHGIGNLHAQILRMNFIRKNL